MVDRIFKKKPFLIIVSGFVALLSFCLYGTNYQITIYSTQIDRTGPGGKDWDTFNKLPDPFVTVIINGNKQFSTSVRDNTCSPEWDETFTIDYRHGDTIVIEVWDQDLAFNDLIGRWKSDGLPGEEIGNGSFRNLKIRIN